MDKEYNEHKKYCVVFSLATSEQKETDKIEYIKKHSAGSGDASVVCFV